MWCLSDGFESPEGSAEEGVSFSDVPLDTL